MHFNEWLAIALFLVIVLGCWAIPTANRLLDREKETALENSSPISPETQA